ncbi:hypothetical protein SAMN05192544_100240 [Paraburkholderia hospita]|nr:hypothetical protein SAMN05192544_100240 [Paraburkholderia hospita]
MDKHSWTIALFSPERSAKTFRLFLFWRLKFILRMKLGDT